MYPRNLCLRCTPTFHWGLDHPGFGSQSLSLSRRWKSALLCEDHGGKWVSGDKVDWKYGIQGETTRRRLSTTTMQRTFPPFQVKSTTLSMRFPFSWNVKKCTQKQKARPSSATATIACHEVEKLHQWISLPFVGFRTQVQRNSIQHPFHWHVAKENERGIQFLDSIPDCRPWPYLVIVSHRSCLVSTVEIASSKCQSGRCLKETETFGGCTYSASYVLCSNE